MGLGCVTVARICLLAKRNSVTYGVTYPGAPILRNSEGVSEAVGAFSGRRVSRGGTERAAIFARQTRARWRRARVPAFELDWSVGAGHHLECRLSHVMPSTPAAASRFSAWNARCSASGVMWWKSAVRRSFGFLSAAFRIRAAACGTLARH